MPKRLLVLLLLLSPLAHAQTWFKVAVESDYFAITNATQPVTLRFGAKAGITSDGTDCSRPTGCWSQFSPALPMAQVFIDAGFAGWPAPAPGIVKEVDVQETTVIQSVLVNGSVVIVPALPPPPPPPSYPPVSFTIGSLYYMVVQNLPPATSTSPLQALLSIKNGEILIAAFVCTYSTTETLPTPAPISGTPPELSALFGCIPLPLPTQ